MPAPATLLDALANWDEAPAVYCAGGGPKISRQQLRKQIIVVANRLKASGIKPGDAVNVSETNTVRLAFYMPVVTLLALPATWSLL